MNFLKSIKNNWKKAFKAHETFALKHAALIRRKWLQSFFIYLAVSVFINAIVLVSLYTGFGAEDINYAHPLFILLQLLAGLFIFAMPFYFGYKKGGTKALMFALVISFKGISDAAIDIYMNYAQVSAVEIITSLILVVCVIYYAHWTLRLYWLNSGLKRAKA